jgi:hypothetical protein
MTLLLQAGCGVRSYSLSISPPELRLVTAAGSDWQQADLAAQLVPADGGWQLSIASTGSKRAGTLLFEAHFSPEYSASQVQRFTPDGKLCLLVADRPGMLALGVILPSGETIAPGELLRATLVHNTGPVRSASRLPTGGAGLVSDLAGTEDGIGGYSLDWSYRNTGDYDQNSEANIADLTPLASHLGHSTTTSDHAGLDAVLDGDSNTEVNIADLTPLGVNFLSRVDGYRLFRADGPDPATAASTQIAELAFGDSQPPNNGRRLFQMAAPQAELQIGAYYFVKPFEQASSEEGSPSNAVQFTSIASMKFRVPPAGSSIADSGQAQNPTLVLMPAIPGLSQEGAPVIAFTTLGGGGSVTPLLLTYYNGSAWVTEDIGGSDNYSMPKAAWIPGTDGNPGQGIVTAYDYNSLSLVCIHFDESWVQTGTETIDAETGVFSRLAFDREPVTGQLGLAHAYTGLGSNSIVYSFTDAVGAWTTEPVSSVTDTLGGLEFRFDPSGGDPWLLFTHGTAVTSPTISLQFALEQARRSGGSWDVTTVPYPDSPMSVDLGFRADGTPQLASVAARDYTINIPTLDPLTISLLFDVISGEYNGSSWSWKKPFESTFGFSLAGLFPPKLTLELNLATDVSWAKPDELAGSLGTGAILLDLTTYMPEDGALEAGTQYMQRDGSGFYSETGYYGGEPGRSFAWALDTSGNPVCAYIRSTDITAQDVLAGNFDTAGELAYWQP